MNETADAKPAVPAPKETSALMVQLPKVAAAALVLSQIPWALNIAEQFRGERGPLAAWNAIVLVWCLVAAFLVWRRTALAFVPALFTAWYVAVFSAVFALTFELSIFWFSLGAGGVAVVAVTKAREGLPGIKPARPPAPEGETFAQWAKENVEAIVIAFIMALVIRCFCIEVFKIPSSSMEPTLLGDVTDRHRPTPSESDCPAWWEHYSTGSRNPRPGGDRIMVTKYFYSFTDVRRYDVVVFKFPLNQSKNFIKRVVGLPGERLYVYRGNLFTDGRDGNREKQDFKVARRPFDIQNSAWVDVRPDGKEFLDTSDGTSQAFTGSWTALPLSGMLYAESVVENGELRTRENEGTRDVLFQFSRRSWPGGWEGNDAHLTFDFELTSQTGELFAAIQNDYGRFTLRLSTEGDSRFQWHLPGTRGGQPRRNAPLPAVRIVPDRRYRLDVGVFDGRAYARLDRDLLHEFTLFETRHELDELMTLESVKNVEADHVLEFGAKGATFAARDLRVGRDFYYQPPRTSSGGRRFEEDQIQEIPDKHYMMMGDNVRNSHDSRAWSETVFTLADDREIHAEGQEISRSGLDDLQKRFGLTEQPDIHIKADRKGYEWLLYEAGREPSSSHRAVAVLKEDGKEGPNEFRFVHERFIVGKAFWIWWPPGRWFTLIR